MGIFRMEASHFLCHHLGGDGTGVDLGWRSERFLVSKFFLGVSTWQTEKNWSQVENQGFGAE